MSYETTASTFASSRDRQQRSEIGELLSTLQLRPTESVLDIGCGGGHLIPHLEKQLWHGEYLGIDASEQMIAEAQKRFPERAFLVHDMREHMNRNTYDVIACIASLHHIMSPTERVEVLKKLLSISHAGTRLIMTNWRLHEGQFSHKKGIEEISDRDYRVKLGSEERLYHSFTDAEMRALLEGAWWKPERIWLDQRARNQLVIASR